jgi:hypothetical protein
MILLGVFLYAFLTDPHPRSIMWVLGVLILWNATDNGKV